MGIPEGLSFLPKRVLQKYAIVDYARSNKLASRKEIPMAKKSKQSKKKKKLLKEIKILTDEMRDMRGSRGFSRYSYSNLHSQRENLYRQLHGRDRL